MKWYLDIDTAIYKRNSQTLYEVNEVIHLYSQFKI